MQIFPKEHTRRAVGISSIAILALLASCSEKEPETSKIELPAASKDGTPVVAMIGETPVTLAALKVTAAQNGYDLREPDQAELALRDAVNSEVLAAEAQRLGYTEDPEIQRLVKAQSVRKLLLATVDSPDKTAPEPSEAELRAYYDNNLDEFTSPTVARAQLLAVLKRPEGDSDKVATQSKLESVQQGIAAGTKPFAELVKEFSDDPSAKTNGGITNWIVQGQKHKRYPAAVLDALFALEVGEVTPQPIDDGRWIYFVKLAEKRDGRVTPFEQAQRRIAQQLVRQRRLKAYDQLVDSIKSDYPIQTFPEKVQQAIEASSASDGPPAGPVSISRN